MSDKESLKAALDRISKCHEVVVSQIKNIDRPTIDVIPSGSLTIDLALGVKGYPRGRMIEIYGQPSGGKTTLALLAIAACQKQGGVAAFVDVEFSFDPVWAEKLGVNVDDLIFVQPEKGGEQALAVIEDLVKTDQVDLVILDSVAGLVPRIELEGELGDAQMASQARMLSQALRRLTGSIGISKAVVLFINQTRSKLGGYVVTQQSTGGESLKFYSSIRLEVKKVSQSDIKEGDTILGHKIEISVKKNKVAPPFTKAELTLRYLEGVDRVEELISLGLSKEVIKQAGPTYSFGDVSAKGLEKFSELVRGSEKVQKSLWEAIQDVKK